MEPRPKKLLDRVREAIQRKHYSHRTEESYIYWIKRYIFFHNKRHPQEMGSAEAVRWIEPKKGASFGGRLHKASIVHTMCRQGDSR